MTNDHKEELADLEPEDGDAVKGGGVNEDLRYARDLVAKQGLRVDKVDKLVDDGRPLE